MPMRRVRCAAVLYLDQMAGYAAALGRPVEENDLAAALGQPSLTRDEQLVRDLAVEAAGLPAETLREAEHQGRVLLRPTSSEAEKQAARRLLRTLVAYQRASRPAAPPSKQRLRQVLEEELLGLEPEKELVVQTLYARQRRVLLFMGAPGTGKTALARATAKASGRALVRVDMAALTREQLTGRPALYGGTGKESVLIRRIIRGGRSALILLDEIDKARPDVMECLLELFENKCLFADAFLGRVDLSQHLIVLSGNEPDRISRPLLDRCQVIGMHPYTPGEKAALLRVKWHAALAAEQLPDQPLSGELVRWVVQRCASGGARDIETACTCLVRQVAAGHGLPRNEADLQRLLGGGAPEPPVIREPGTVYCLSVLADGGGQVNPLMVRENLAPGAPRLKTLGLGADLAIQESAEMAATWAANTLPLPLPPLVIAMDASTKSGPSAGAAMALACYSLLTGRVLTGVAATGELLLDGTVLPVGGIPSKLIGVLRCARRVRTLFLPAANRFEVTPRLLAELAAAGVTLHFIGRMQDAIQILEAGKKDREQ